MSAEFDELSVAEAADALALSERRVRAMLRDGVLRGRRSGGRWLIGRGEMEQIQRRRRRPGRPLGQRKAWALLEKLSSGVWPSELPAWDRSRLRHKAEVPLLDVADDLRVRAERRSFRGDPRMFGSLSADPRLVRSGVSAAAAYGADIRDPGVVEGYVRRADLDAVVYRYALRAAALPEANVILHVVDGEVPRAREGVAPRAAVALDLLESGDPRAQRAGRDLARGHR